MKTILALLLVPCCVFAQIAPAGLYALAYLAWDSPGCTNWQVLIRTQTNALPIHSFEIQQKITAVSNLQYGVTYYLSVKAQSNNVWSAESDLYKWPHDRTNYVSTIAQTAPTILGQWTDVPSSLRTEINPPSVSAVWRLKIFESNNITPFIISQ
jgi:hypothetical protein